MPVKTTSTPSKTQIQLPCIQSPVCIMTSVTRGRGLPVPFMAVPMRGTMNVIIRSDITMLIERTIAG